MALDIPEKGFTNSLHGEYNRKENSCSTSPRSRLRDSKYLLADFGICAHTNHANSKYEIQEGDKVYMPLEVFALDKENRAPIDLTKVDVFSFGLILLQLMTGNDLPDKGPEWINLRSNNLADELLSMTEYSEQLKKIVISCLDKAASSRPSFPQILSQIIVKKDFNQRLTEKREEARITQRMRSYILSTELDHDPMPIPEQRECIFDFDSVRNIRAE